MHTIDKTKLVENITDMINLLEFDAMRSAGKAKMNSQHLHSLHYLKSKYESEIVKPVKKEK